MYTWTTPLSIVTGIGPTVAERCAKKGWQTVGDLLLALPLRYEDRSQRTTIEDAPVDQLITLQVQVRKAQTYYKGRRSIQSATLVDETGQLKAMWFNVPYVIERLRPGTEWLVSGKINSRNILVQPNVEPVEGDHVHTDRLVPIYSSALGLKPGLIRRLLKHICDGLQTRLDPLVSLAPQLQPVDVALKQLHFPDADEMVIAARERLALQELLALMQKSHALKAQWQATHPAVVIPEPPAWPTALQHSWPAHPLPFPLTPGQVAAVHDVMADVAQPVAMNRLLIGDVGAGKTVVAGLAAWNAVQHGYVAALIAPTQLLATQHSQTLAKLFPELSIDIITGGRAKKTAASTTPRLVIGTHAVINRLPQLQPALVIYDEQHRFGVMQRSQGHQVAVRGQFQPHTLTMTATPIPRTLLLSVFGHLSVSTLTELPPGRIPTKTWLVPQRKQDDAYSWLAQEVTKTKGLALVVCPFIDPSHAEALENVAAVTQRFAQLQESLAESKLRLGLLHGRLPKTAQQAVIDDLFAGRLDVLVTTPMVEVGVDLPTANIIIIEGAERFGLASLHQLRGRVGRAGQPGYCLLFGSTTKAQDSHRLNEFCKRTQGQELAELDLQQRGAGDLFGTRQHGFDELHFADWTNLKLITQARELFPQVEAKLPDWQPFPGTALGQQLATLDAEKMVAAN